LLGAATRYDGLVKDLIWQLKYQKKTAAAKPLIAIMESYLERLNLPLKNFAIIPIPLHPSKERQRGFNQSLIIAESIAKNLNGELLLNCLIKVKNTPPQMEINDWQKRQVNIKDSFQIKNHNAVKNKNILLIDDVVTSGSTFNEAVRVLKQNHAGKIIALAIAKAS